MILCKLQKSKNETLSPTHPHIASTDTLQPVRQPPLMMTAVPGTQPGAGREPVLLHRDLVTAGEVGTPGFNSLLATAGGTGSNLPCV